MTNQPTARQQANGRTTQPTAPASPQPAIVAAPPAAPAQPAPAPVVGTPTAHPQATFTEAPSSLNLRFDFMGYEGIQLTLRDVSGTALLNKLPAIMDKLEKMGATPTAERKRGGQAQASEASEASAAQGGIPVCQYHGPMKASTKKPGSYYCPAKMGDGSYCKEKSG